MKPTAIRNTVIAALMLALPVAAALAEDAKPAVMAVEVKATEKTFDVHFTNAELGHILETLASQSGEKIVPEGALPNVSVTLNTTRMSLPAVLDALTRETDTTWAREADGRIVVRAKDPKALTPNGYGERSSTGALITGVSLAIAPEELAAAVRLVVTPEGKVTVDPASGRVDVQDKPEGVKRAKEVMRLIAEAHPNQETMISDAKKVPAGT